MSVVAVCVASYFAARSPDTIAHKTLPFGTVLKITHLGTGKSIQGVVKDRGPFIAGRCVDLSKPLARELGITGSGVARVQVDMVSLGAGRAVRARLGRHKSPYRQPAAARVEVPTILGIPLQ